MARSPLIVALAAGLIILLSTINIFHRLYPLDYQFSNWSFSNPLLNSAHESTFSAHADFLVGVGKADITGPVVEINFMGYADPAQLGTGVRQRLYSRAFIVGDPEIPEDRFVYLVLDTQSGDTAVRHGILEALADLGPEFAMYGNQNVAVTGTHSHSGPGAWLNYLLPQITSKGFHKPSYQAIVNGAVESIKRAHLDLAPGLLSFAQVDIDDANINRSPYAYLANPKEERERYEHDVDKSLTALLFSHRIQSDERDIGMLTWFAVHGTSMYGNNTLVTGDNKGVAAWLLEKSTNDPKFVAGFSQANVGDTSPNVLGAYCEWGEQEGDLCDFKTSLCGNKTQPCHGRGPYYGREDGGTASTYEIGRRQFLGAKWLFDNNATFKPIHRGAVKSFHQFADLSNYDFALPNGSIVRTCPAALGYSFAAGTSDGPGAFDFKQAQPGDPHANPLWSAIGNRIHKPNDTQIACHGDKVILLDVGESDIPYPWSPNIVDVQLFRVGQFFIVISPGEATTMAGRRWRDAVRDTAVTAFDDLRKGDTEPMVVLGGPANSYTHYITTPEEYSIQRYEGASTLYGPHTLDAYINLTLTHLPRLDASEKMLPKLSVGPRPPILINESLSFITPVIVDRPSIFKSFGDPIKNPTTFNRAGDTISATFLGANPRNNLRLDGTFAAVDKFDYSSKSWYQFRDDQDWSLVFEWRRTSTILGTSEVTISWETSWETGEWATSRNGQSHSQQRPYGDLIRGRDNELSGLYRFRYNGDAKTLGGTISEFQGQSEEFQIL